jgi:RepB DNA-primase from phage plasmid
VSSDRSEPKEKTISSPEYICANFESSDRIAILVRNAKRGETTQRITTTTKAADVPFQDWMRYKNERDGCDVYVGMNALKATAFTRTKHDIAAIRHLYADFDHDGSASLSAIEKSPLVPAPNFVLSTSPDKYQAIWRVEGIDVAQAEALLHALAREFDGDHAATDAARVLRLPGFHNKKYDQDFLVTATWQTDRIYHPSDFKLKVEAPESSYSQIRSSPRPIKPIEPRHISQSERDWAHVKSALAQGANPDELIAELARSRASDKSDPQYYARLTVRKALAEVRLYEDSAEEATPEPKTKNHAERS